MGYDVKYDAVWHFSVCSVLSLCNEVYKKWLFLSAEALEYLLVFIFNSLFLVMILHVIQNHVELEMSVSFDFCYNITTHLIRPF